LKTQHKRDGSESTPIFSKPSKITFALDSEQKFFFLDFGKNDLSDFENKNGFRNFRKKTSNKILGKILRSFFVENRVFSAKMGELWIDHLVEHF